MSSIEINVLGRFQIIVDGNDIVARLDGSKKKLLLLEYLIMNRGKTVSVEDLFNALWPNEENRNPEGALKTMVSRLRTNLEEFGLPRAIVTKDGSYQWNTKLNARIDVYEFEALCDELLAVETLDETSGEKFESAIGLYRGDLLPNAGLERWVVLKSVAYHNLYLQMVQRYISLLEALGRDNDLIRVCRMAMEIDALDNTLNLQLMSALLKVGKGKEALKQYELMADMHYTQLGVLPPEKIVNLYQKLVKSEKAFNADIEEIRKELQETNPTEGAFVCDYAIFKDIYHLHMRNLKRIGASMFLVLITITSVSEEVLDPLSLDKHMRVLLPVLQKNLRRGDTVSRFSLSQYAVLLPMVNYDTGRLALERVRKAFYAKCDAPDILFSYKLAPIDAEG